MPSIVIGARAQFSKRYGQFNGHIQNAGDPVEPCIILTPANRSSGGPAFGIALSKLHEYFDKNGIPTGYALTRMEDAARLLGFEDRASVRKLLDAVYDMAAELVKAMPEELLEQPKPAKAIGEAEARIDGELVAREELYQ